MPILLPSRTTLRQWAQDYFAALGGGIPVTVNTLAEGNFGSTSDTDVFVGWYDIPGVDPRYV